LPSPLRLGAGAPIHFPHGLRANGKIVAPAGAEKGLPNPRYRPHPVHNTIDFVDVAVDAAAGVRRFACRDQRFGRSNGGFHAGEMRFHLGLGGAQFR